MRLLVLFSLLLTVALASGQQIRHLWQPLDIGRYGGGLSPSRFGTLVVFTSDSLSPKIYIVADAPVEEVRMAGLDAFGTKPELIQDRSTKDLSTVEFRFPKGEVTLRGFTPLREPLRIYVTPEGGSLALLEKNGNHKLDAWPAPGTVWRAESRVPASVALLAPVTVGLVIIFVLASVGLSVAIASGEIGKRWSNPWLLVGAGIGAVGLIPVFEEINDATTVPLPALQPLALMLGVFALVLAATIRSYRAGQIILPILLSLALSIIASIAMAYLKAAWPEVRWFGSNPFIPLFVSFWPSVLTKRRMLGFNLDPIPSTSSLSRRTHALAERMGVEISGVWMSDEDISMAAVIPYRRIVLTEKLRDRLTDRETDAVLAHEIGHLCPMPPAPRWFVLTPLSMVPALAVL
ncbi:hypothetical protein EON81_05690, partial [bacterium]